MADDIPWERLFEEATRVRSRAHVPYSRFPVGAAVLYADGAVVAQAPLGFFKESERYDLTIVGIARDGRVARGLSSVDVLDV